MLQEDKATQVCFGGQTLADIMAQEERGLVSQGDNEQEEASTHENEVWQFNESQVVLACNVMASSAALCNLMFDQ